MAKLNPGKCNELLPASFVVLAVIYAGVLGRLDVLVLSAGIGLICTGLKLPLYTTLFIAAVATFLGAFLPFGGPDEIIVKQMASRDHFANNDENEQFEEAPVQENFANNDEEDGVVDDKEYFDEKDEKFKGKEEEDFDEEHFEEENFEDDEEEFTDTEDFEEGFANEEKPKKKKSKKVRPPPNNGDRAEPLVLGKKYKIPSEDDDEDYHLDAGTTFLNAYKSLNPDQISAMTKDTQDLINTQKQLMSTLNTLKPLITDGKQMMETFGSYFGGEGGAAAGMGDLSKLAEKFANGAK
jgi:hypothetical protein